jgi:universal stress protein A
MAVYQRIVLAVDLTEESRYVGNRGRNLATALGAELELLHVVEPVPMIVPAPEPVVVPVPTVDELVETARSSIEELARELGVSVDRCIVATGDTRAEIVRVARERKFDLIVLGTHERHGLKFLIKPTEDAVLHRASCDVLGVRVPRTVDAK